MAQGEYSIRIACQISGVNEHTLRSWEKRYEILQPKRSETGRRIYSEADVNKLRYIKRLIEEGHSISFIAGKSVDSLKDLMLKSEALKESPRAEVETLNSFIADNVIDVDLYVSKIQKHLAIGDEVEVERFIRTARLKTNNLFYITKFIPSILKKIGDKVFVDDYGIWQEHIISSIVRTEIFSLYKELKMNNTSSSYQSRGIDMVITTTNGNYHEIGPLLVACLCEFCGKKTLYLGPSLPVLDLINMHQKISFKNLVLGAVSLPPEERGDSIHEVLEKLIDAGISNENIFLGGYISEPDKKKIEQFKTNIFSSVEEFYLFLLPSVES